MTYALTFSSRQALALLLQAGNEDTLLLSRPENSITANVSLERAGGKLIASILLGSAQSTITLQAADPANEQHLADYIESIANGTVDTAMAPPLPGDPTPSPCRACGSHRRSEASDYQPPAATGPALNASQKSQPPTLSAQDERTLRLVAREGGQATVAGLLHVTVHRSPGGTKAVGIVGLGANTRLCEGSPRDVYVSLAEQSEELLAI